MRWLPLVVLLVGCPKDTASETPTAPSEIPVVDAKTEADAFLIAYTAKLVELDYAASEAEWKANTYIVEGDEETMKAASAAREALAAFTGSVEVIDTTRKLLEKRDGLSDLQIRQLERVLRLAAPNPQIVPDKVKALIEAESKQTHDLYGYEFTLDGAPITPNEIDRLLIEETDLAKRQAVWEASKAIGPVLEDNLVVIRGLRNDTVQALGYDDFYTYQIDEYGMTVDEMTETLERVNKELRPLYRELHTWARYELAERYGVDVPEQLPAHWLPNRWGQDWASLVEVEGVDVDAALADKEPEWIVKEGEAFYVSLGFPELPPVFWEKSSLYPVAPDAGFKKNTHASAWHMDTDKDVRSLMSVEPNARWFETTNHELGHIYYYISYSTDDCPPLLRRGANRAFHEAVGSLMGMAAMQVPYLQARGLVEQDVEYDEIQQLLQEALNSVVFIPFATGTMPGFERALYVDDLPAEQFNAKWWEVVGKYQGIVPPTERGEEYADALTKTHINDDPGQYYDYALSYVLLFQLHDHIAKEILHQPPQATNYFGNQEVGDYLRSILEPGATRDWRELTREATGSDLSAEPMLEYFAPLMTWLQEQNEGRTHTLPEL